MSILLGSYQWMWHSGYFLCTFPHVMLHSFSLSHSLSLWSSTHCSASVLVKRWGGGVPASNYWWFGHIVSPSHSTVSGKKFTIRSTLPLARINLGNHDCCQATSTWGNIIMDLTPWFFHEQELQKYSAPMQKWVRVGLVKKNKHWWITWMKTWKELKKASGEHWWTKRS
jgi:hypothetical protein